jgi:DNA-binding cell septation regulator SpoVG
MADFKIVVLKLTRPTKPGNLKAFVDVQIGQSLVFFGCKVIQQPDQRAFVAPPSVERTGEDGKKKYYPTMEWRGSLKAAIETAILQAWKEAGS